MKRLLLLAVFILGVFCWENIFAQEATPKKVPKGIKKICLTFDNLPAEREYGERERNEINEGILSTLGNHKILAAGFVVGDNIAGDWEIVVKWLEAGHTIGFMTYSGQDIENVPVDIFMADVAKGKEVVEDLLQSYKQKARYFRYPYLHYGSSPEVRNRVEGLITEQKITIAHASIVVEDFVYNLTLEKLYNGMDSLKIMQLRDEYIEHILERLGDAETLAMDIVNRPIRHILQLRANRINSLFLEDILAAIADKGYEFTSLNNALKDKVYKILEDYYGTKGLSYLERIKNSE